MKTKKRPVGLLIATSFFATSLHAQTKMHETVYNTSPQNIHYVTDHYSIADGHRLILSYFHEDWQETSSPNHTIVTQTNVDGVVVNARELKNFRGKQIIQGTNHFNVLSEKESKLVGFNFNGYNTWSKQYLKNNEVITFEAMATLSGYYNGSQILAAGAEGNELNLAVIDIIDGAIAIQKSHIVGESGRQFKVTAVYCGLNDGYLLALNDQWNRTFLVKLDFNLDITWVKKIIAEEQSHNFEFYEIRALGSEQVVLAGTSTSNENGIVKPIVMNIDQDGSQFNYIKVYSTNSIDQMCKSAEMSGGTYHLAVRNEDPNYTNAHTYEYIALQGFDGTPTAGRRYSVSTSNQSHTTIPQATHIVLNQGVHMVGTVISNIHAVQTDYNGNSCDSEPKLVLGLPIEAEFYEVSHEEDPEPITASNRSIEIEEKDITRTQRCEQELRSSLFEGEDPTIENSDQSISIYPNPSNGQTTLSMEGIDYAKFFVLDMSGKIVQTGAYNGNKITIEGLSKGLYNVQIQTEQKLFTKRLVIQ